MRTSTLTHAEIMQKYGISRNKIRAYMLNNITLPHSTYAAMEIHCIRSYNGADFLSQVFDGMFPLHKLDYSIIYKDCTPSEVRKSNIVVHFRAAKEELNIEPICLVRIYPCKES